MDKNILLDEQKDELPEILEPEYFSLIHRKSSLVYLSSMEFILKKTLKKLKPGLFGIFGLRKLISILDNMLCSNSNNHYEPEKITLSNIQAELIKSKKTNGKTTIFYLHGGAFAFRFNKTQTEMIGNLAQSLNCNAVMVKYRLAPEHPFPAATDDCFEAYKSLINNGTNPKDIVFLGDSAGGNLVLVTLMKARDEGLPMPSCAVLLSPALDFSLSGSHVEKTKKLDPIFTKEILYSFAKMYLPDFEKANQFEVSPILGDFSNLPPLLFQAGTHEILMDDSVNAASRAHAAGVDVKLEIYEDMPHVFQAFPKLPEATTARKNIVKFIRKNSQPKNQ